MNGRKKALLLFGFSSAFLIFVTAAGMVCEEAAERTDFACKNLAPCLSFPFGTDWMGRDMLARTLAGLSLSIRIGLCTAGASALLALLLGISAAMLGKHVDALVSFLIDTIMGIPHILLLLLISYACGKGFRGVVLGVALTHWPSLARVIRGEVLQQKNSDYVAIAARLGEDRFRIALRHMLPHILPQFVVGLILMFPHAILHEASITFLGFGLPSNRPALGVILSESMRYLITGKWWLAVLPGGLLVLVTLLFHTAGNALQRLLDPVSAQE